MSTFTQLETSIKAFRVKLEELEINLANLIQHVSINIPTTAELNRIRSELVLIKESLGDAEITTDTSSTTSSDITAVYTELNSLRDEIINMKKQINGLQLQVDDLRRAA